MAHVQKNTMSAVGHLFDHYGRNAEDERYKYLYRSNDSIDPERTKFNYNLAPSEKSQLEILKERLSQVKVLKRKDVNVMCSWVVTAPKDLEQQHFEKFFQETYNFLENRYGKENVVSAYVHMDETTPHIHFAFVPVVYDKKKDVYKVSAKECINKLELKSFHQDLDKYLEQSMGFKVNVLNEITKEGNKSIEELKRGSAIDRLKAIEEQLNNIKYQLEPLKAEYEAKKAFIQQAEKDSDISVMYPDYAVISKKGLLKKEEFVTVPKDKWEAKHVAANHVNALNREYRELEKIIQDFKSTSEELRDIKKFKKENDSLRHENDELKMKLERTQRLFSRVLEQNPDIKAKLENERLRKQKSRTFNQGIER